MTGQQKSSRINTQQISSMSHDLYQPMTHLSVHAKMSQDCMRSCSGGSRIFQTGRCKPQRSGHQPIILPNSSQTLHENERNWTQRGASLVTPPLDRPMRWSFWIFIVIKRAPFIRKLLKLIIPVIIQVVL